MVNTGCSQPRDGGSDVAGGTDALRTVESSSSGKKIASAVVSQSPRPVRGTQGQPAASVAGGTVGAAGAGQLAQKSKGRKIAVGT